MNRLHAFWNSPMGPKTTHFWGPVFNWGFVMQGAMEFNRPAENISRDMQMTLTLYSTMFMRFALRVQPTNYLLFTCHFFNTGLQGNLLLRRLQWESDQEALKKDQPEKLAVVPTLESAPAPQEK
jgi:hypothetical protein